MNAEQKQALIVQIRHYLQAVDNSSTMFTPVSVFHDMARIALGALTAPPVACKKRLVNHRSGVAHHWTYHGEVDRPSSGDIFRVEVVPLYEHPAPAADLVPEGWKLVPVEPTTKQWAAGVKAMDAGIDKPTLCYSAMLAAAPEVE